MVENLKLDLSLGKFNVEKGKHILLLLLLLLLYSLHVIDDEIIFMSSLLQICNSLTFMLSWF